MHVDEVWLRYCPLMIDTAATIPTTTTKNRHNYVRMTNKCSRLMFSSDRFLGCCFNPRNLSFYQCRIIKNEIRKSGFFDRIFSTFWHSF